MPLIKVPSNGKTPAKTTVPTFNIVLTEEPTTLQTRTQPLLELHRSMTSPSLYSRLTACFFTPKRKSLDDEMMAEISETYSINRTK